MLPFLKHRERVIIISGNTVIKKKKCTLDGNTIIIEKGSRGKGNIGWKVPVRGQDWKYYRKLGFLKRKLEIKVDAKNFIPFGTELENVEVPTCTRKDIEEYSNANVIKKSGMSTQKIEVPILLYLLVGGVLILQIIQFMMSQGMIVR